jgi:DNA-binding PadR family transcriptional regulator
VSNLLGLAMLTYLTQRPMHAYELHRQLKDNDAATTFKLSYGALYSVVRQLLKAELIAEAGTGRTGQLPEHTRYALTDAGRAEIDSWMRELLAEPRHEYPAFAAALSLIVVLRPDDVCVLLEARLGRLAALRVAIVEQRDATIGRGVHAVFLVEDDYRVALLDAEAEFVRDLLFKIRNPDSGWTGPWDSYHSGGGAGLGEDR